MEAAPLPASLQPLLLHGVWRSFLVRCTRKSKQGTKEPGRCGRPFHFPKPTIGTRSQRVPWDLLSPSARRRARRWLLTLPQRFLHVIRHPAELLINAVPRLWSLGSSNTAGVWKQVLKNSERQQLEREEKKQRTQCNWKRSFQKDRNANSNYPALSFANICTRFRATFEYLAQSSHFW